MYVCVSSCGSVLSIFGKDSHHVKMRISESCTTHVPQAALSLGEVRLIICCSCCPNTATDSRL